MIRPRATAVHLQSAPAVDRSCDPLFAEAAQYEWSSPVSGSVFAAARHRYRHRKPWFRQCIQRLIKARFPWPKEQKAAPGFSKETSHGVESTRPRQTPQSWKNSAPCAIGLFALPDGRVGYRYNRRALESRQARRSPRPRSNSRRTPHKSPPWERGGSRYPGRNSMRTARLEHARAVDEADGEMACPAENT